MFLPVSEYHETWLFFRSLIENGLESGYFLSQFVLAAVDVEKISKQNHPTRRECSEQIGQIG